jgi:hypothetical protein
VDVHRQVPLHSALRPGPIDVHSARRSPEHVLVHAAALLSLLVPAVQLADLAFPGRAVLALAFFVLAPGAPLVVLLRLRSLALTLALAFAASLSILLLLSTVLVKIPFWHPGLATGLAAATCLGLTKPALNALAGEPPPPPSEVVVDRERHYSLVALAASVALWVVAVQRAPLDQLGSLGLVRVVGPAYWAGLLVLVVIAVRQLRRPVPDPVVLSGLVIVLALELYGFLNAADSGASLSTGYLHVGFIQYILDHGQVAHYYDARFSWPAFFAAGGVLTRAGGTDTALTFLRPAPVVDILLCLPALWSIALSVTKRVPVAWLSVITFLSLDWYGQEYFSPQGTVFVLYVGVLAMVLHYAPAPRELFGKQAPWRHPFSGLGSVVPRDPGASVLLVLGREAIVLLVCAAVVVSHQLTPLNLMVILVVLVVTGATRMRGLWLLVTLVFIAWFTFGAAEYWRGNVGSIFGDIGKIGSTVGSAVGNRLVGDQVHSRMQSIRLAWAAGSVLVALLGLWRLRHSTWFWTLAGLALGPFSLVFVQSYGGEVALRCFLYAEPLLAPLVAMVVWQMLHALPDRTRVAALGTALFVAFAMLTTTRGANAAFERQTSGDIAAARYVFDHHVGATDGTVKETIGTLEDVGFAGLAGVTTWAPVSLSPSACLPSEVEPCVEDRAPDYVLVTPTMDSAGVLQDGLEAGWTGKVAGELITKGLYKRVFTDQGAFVLQRVAQG